MKKILIFFALMAIGAVVMAQTATMKTYTFRPGENILEYSPAATYYLGGNMGYDTLNIYVLANKTTPVRAVAYVDIGARGGTTDTYSYDLQAKMYSAESFASVYKGTGKYADFSLADTTLFSEVEIGKFYRYWQVQLATDNDCATTDSLTLTKITIKLIEF